MLMRRVHTSTALTALLTTLALTTASCSLIGSADEAGGGDTVVLVAHDSFSLPDGVVKKFEDESGYRLDIRTVGDAGTLTNQLVLTEDDPLGDVAFGVDNTFGSRALEEGVFAPYAGEVPAGVDDYDLPGDDDHVLTPVDNGSVCVNVDDTWFQQHDQAPPTTLDDLTDPAYQDLLVTPSATTSSTGLAFLLATIGEYGDDWPTYWSDLVGNGAKVTKGWEDAYNVDFTQGAGGHGTRPIVVSYDSSPAFTVKGGRTTTSALLDTCFQQIEYAGLIDGASNPEGGRALIDFLVGPEVQAALPESMYVFPVADDTELPADWARFARSPSDPLEVDPAEIADRRADWLREWSDVISR